ncbi:MAG: hypothetical protein HQL34_05155 [Alphaproteobacteria bacterium]|nr:hypothetical protein [Alphaproteobacteria bacterium]
MSSSFDNPVLVAAALQASAIALAGNESYESARGIATLAKEILEEWDRVLMNMPHLSRRR